MPASDGCKAGRAGRMYICMFFFPFASTPFHHICSVAFNLMTRFYRRPAQLTMELEAKPPLNPLYTPFFTPLGGLRCYAPSSADI